MIRVVSFLVVVLLLAAGLHWLADRPGTISIEWVGYVIETSVFRGLIILAIILSLAMALWSLVRHIWQSPAAFGRYLHGRRQKRGLDALTSGIIAVGAGDRASAVRYAAQARKALPHEPLTHLLRAQAAQIGGDRATARRIFEAMLASPETEQLGLRGLYLEAEREGEREAARQFAERALQRNPRLGWPVEALFDLQCGAENWQAALDTLEVARRHHLFDKATVNRRRAVLLTAQAQPLEDSNADRALDLALEAHKLAPDLVPAAAIAGRILSARGNTPRAARIVLKTWRLSPHPDLAAAYAYARPGDSPRDRLNRVRHLARLTPNDVEAQIAVAVGAIDAHDWPEARRALEPLLADRLTPRICTLMARIEAEQNGDAGRVREWLARAATAARDPAWTTDGVVSDQWKPVSPVTGALDAFEWRPPVEASGSDQAAGALAAKVEALMALSTAEGARPGDRLEISSSEEIVTVEPVPPTGAEPARDDKVTFTPHAREHPAPEQPPKATNATAPAEEHDSSATAAPKPVALPPREQPAAVERGEEKRPANEPRTRKPVEPRIFVPPRAPDDPGTDPAEDDYAAYPASGVKA